MMDMPVVRKVMWILVLVVMPSPSSFALTDEEIYRQFRFNFINPGARSLGLGGAFIALADDATAAGANPAGLTNLTRPQVFMEVRHANPRSTRDEQELSGGGPTENVNFRSATDPDRSTAPSFISYVKPWQHVSVGVSRQDIVNSQASTIGSFFNHDIPGDQFDERAEGMVSVHLEHWNVSLGWTLHERFRLGVSLTYGSLELSSRVSNFFATSDMDLIPSTFLAVLDYEEFHTEADGRDNDLTYTAGLLWQPLEELGFGAVYRKGADFVVQQEVSTGCIVVRDPNDDIEIGTCSGPDAFNNALHIPDVSGVGVAWKPMARLTMALDAQRITYSDLSLDAHPGLNPANGGTMAPVPTQALIAGGLPVGKLAVDDRTNVHLGFEYTVQGEALWAFRCGLHQDKDNRIRRAEDVVVRSPFRPTRRINPMVGRDDILHYALGIGMVVENRMQVDFAGDISESGTEVLASLTYRFE